ncbi:MAG: hypothetical protein AAF585_14630 [Verrucomicrobiota bacterium]
MKTGHLLIVLGLTFGAIGYAQEPSEDLNPAVAELHAKYEAALKDAKGDLQTLESRYIEELRKLKTEVEAAGELQVALLIQDEIQNYAQPKARDFGASPKLRKLRELYQDSARRLEPDIQTKRKAVMKDYITRFERLKVVLTQQSNLEAALQAETILKQIDTMLESGGGTAPSATTEPLWTLTGKRDVESVKNCEIDRKGDQFILTSESRDGSYINSDDDFELPIRISARAGTDSTNLRFYLGDIPLTIFNWEGNANQLRIHNPITRRPQAYDGVGYLARNELFDIIIDVRKESINVHLGGKIIGTLTGDFTGASGPVGIGPAFGSVVTVERFEIFEIKETAQ